MDPREERRLIDHYIDLYIASRQPQGRNPVVTHQHSVRTDNGASPSAGPDFPSPNQAHLAAVHNPQMIAGYPHPRIVYNRYSSTEPIRYDGLPSNTMARPTIGKSSNDSGSTNVPN